MVPVEPRRSRGLMPEHIKAMQNVVGRDSLRDAACAASPRRRRSFGRHLPDPMGPLGDATRTAGGSAQHIRAWSRR